MSKRILFEKTAIFAEEHMNPSGIPNFCRQDLIALEVINKSGDETKNICIVSLAPDCTSGGWKVQYFKIENLMNYCSNNDTELILLIKPNDFVDVERAKSWAEQRQLCTISIANRRGELNHILICSKNIRDNQGEIFTEKNKKWGDYIKFDVWAEHTNKGVKIMQINAAKRVDAHKELEILTNKKEVDILMIQEPAMVNKNLRKISNGVTFSDIWKGDNGPRASIWISNDMNPNKNAIQLNDYVDRDMVTVNLRMQSNEGSWNEFILCSVYMPAKNEEGENISDPIAKKLMELSLYARSNNRKVINKEQHLSIRELEEMSLTISTAITEAYESSCRLKRVKDKEKEWRDDTLLEKRKEVRATFNQTKKTSFPKRQKQG